MELLKFNFNFWGRNKGMDITENKVLEVNETIKKMGSLNAVNDAGYLGCHKKTFKRNALKIGYIYDSESKQFIKKEDMTIAPRTSKSTVINKKDDSRIEDIENRLRILESLVLENALINKENNFTLDSRVLVNDTMTRSVKVSKSIMTDFIKLSESSKFTAYSKKDLLSQALLEFIDKYKE